MIVGIRLAALLLAVIEGEAPARASETAVTDPSGGSARWGSGWSDLDPPLGPATLEAAMLVRR